MFHVKHPVAPAEVALTEAALARALDDVRLPPGAVARLAMHWQLVVRWNARTNLTAITDATAAAFQHYRDSLTLLPHLAGGPIADIGSGAGFPGIPLAVARPDVAFVLVEPRRKRASFLESAVAQMGLDNVRVRCARMQDGPEAACAHVVTRATFSAAADLTACLAWLAEGGTVLALRADADPAAHLSHAYALHGRPRSIDIYRR